MIKNYYLPNRKIKIFKNTQSYTNAYNLRSKCGVYSKEDAEYYNKLRQQLLKKPVESSSLSSFQTILGNINAITSTILTDTIKRGQFLYYKTGEQITSKLLKQIRLENFKSIFLNNLNSQDKVIRLPYINTEQKETTPKTLQFGCKDTYFIHPRDKLNNILKENDIDINFSIKYAKIIGKEPLIKILSQKELIIQKINTFLDKADNNYDFVFSKDELKTIKLLANKYDTIENLLVSNGINTKSIETLLFCKIGNKLNTGDKLPNGDIILRFTKIYDKQAKTDTDAIITFANTDRGYRFKIYKYDKNLFETSKQKKEQFHNYVKSKNISNINSLNSKIANIMRDDEIAEVFIEKLNKKQLFSRMQDEILISDKVIENLLREDEDYYYVKNLKNFNIKKYQNVSVQLFSCLKDFGKSNQIHKAFMEALSFNNVEHSPVFLYLRTGCIPISHSKEELEKFLPSGFDFKENVWLMYEMKNC